MTEGRLNRGFVYREVVDESGAGRRVVEHLALGYPHSTAEEWERRAADGLVRIDGREAKAGDALRAGQELSWHRPPWREPDAPRRFEVLHDDEALLVVEKPAGLPTLPGAGFLENTLLDVVRELAPAATPAHRLGRWTSGIVVFGRDPDSVARLSARWNAPETQKRYRLLASGVPDHDLFEVNVPIGPVPYGESGTLHAASPEGRPARTRVEVLERRANGFLADAWLESGRPHQIRIHLAAAGNPLVGDPLYEAKGRPRPGGTARPGDPGYSLHATELHILHPSTEDPITIRCRPPEILRRTR